MNNISDSRMENLDIAKALGIIAVVVGHSGAPFASFVSLYHMALFFFISGYFYQERYTTNPVELIKKRIKTLYLPFALYGLFFGLLHNILFAVNIYTDQVASQYNHVAYLSNRDFLVNLIKIAAFAKVEQIVAPLWFLPVLFIVNILFAACSYGVYKMNGRFGDLALGIVVAILFFAGFAYYPEQNLVLRPVSIGMVVLLVYYFGFLMKKNREKIKLNGYTALLCMAVLLLIYPYGPIDTGGHKFVSPLVYIVSSLCGIYLNLYLAQLLSGWAAVKKLLLVIGRNTIPIMALHFLAFKAVNYLQVRVYHLPPFMTGTHPILSGSGGWWIVYVFAGVVIPVAGKVAADRIRQLFARREQPSAA